MREIFAVSNSGNDDNFNIILPKLITLHLLNLPELTTVCREILVCGSADILSIIHCPKLERLPRIVVYDWLCWFWFWYFIMSLSIHIPNSCTYKIKFWFTCWNTKLIFTVVSPNPEDECISYFWPSQFRINEYCLTNRSPIKYYHSLKWFF